MTKVLFESSNHGHNDHVEFKVTQCQGREKKEGKIVQNLTGNFSVTKSKFKKNENRRPRHSVDLSIEPKISITKFKMAAE